MYIYHLCYNNYVFENIGYTDKENPGKYVYLIHGNFGDFYKVDGVQKNVAKLIINPEGHYSLEIYKEELANYSSLAAGINLIMNNSCI